LWGVVGFALADLKGCVALAHGNNPHIKISDSTAAAAKPQNHYTPKRLQNKAFILQAFSKSIASYRLKKASVIRQTPSPTSRLVASILVNIPGGRSSSFLVLWFSGSNIGSVFSSVINLRRLISQHSQ
jgi:hypothetical protein